MGNAGCGRGHMPLGRSTDECLAATKHSSPHLLDFFTRRYTGGRSGESGYNSAYAAGGSPDSPVLPPAPSLNVTRHCRQSDPVTLRRGHLSRQPRCGALRSLDAFTQIWDRLRSAKPRETPNTCSVFYPAPRQGTEPFQYYFGPRSGVYGTYAKHKFCNF